MARLAFYDPKTWALRNQSAITGLTTGRGIYFDGVSFWAINELATLPITWEIVQLQKTAAGTFTRTYGFPFVIPVLAGGETLIGVTGITGDGMNLYISYKIELASAGPPPVTTTTDYISHLTKNGDFLSGRFGAISGLIASYTDLTWDGYHLIASLGSTQNRLRYFDPTTERPVAQTNVLASAITAVAFNGVNFYLTLGANRGVTLSPQGRILNTSSVAVTQGEGMEFGTEELEMDGFASFESGEWVAILYA